MEYTVKQRMVSVNTLVAIAGVGGMVTAATGLTLHSLLQNRVRSSPVYQEAMSTVKQHPAATTLLGQPIKSDRVDVTNRNNVLSLTLSSLEVPVYGPQNKGVLYVWADRRYESDQWNIYRLELEILDRAGGKLSLVSKKPVLDVEVS